ncbi:MAG: MBL fold metallo-hydrolase [Treponema sp.]|jgi:glyoxylase-like metal-dependent hydrolase (beta-lactamase superfamily II)|nr:MBL fold metallo-hydrolase [Treponema sp.]
MREKILVNRLTDNIRDLNETLNGQPNVDAYLVTGTKRAVLIDSLRNERSLFNVVRELTSLPLDVVLTHGHWDHAGVSIKDFHEAGHRIYLSEKDFYIFRDKEFSSLTHGLRTDYFTPLEEGMEFDLGSYKLEVITLAGHTPGSVVLLEKEKQHLYSGDSIGAGVFWMQLPGALPLKELRKNFGKLWNKVRDMNELMIHPGHRCQSPEQLGLGFLRDMILVTDNIISGAWPGEENETVLSNGRRLKCRSVAYNLIRDYCYNPENIQEKP